MSSDAEVADAARNLADSLSRLKATTAGYGRGKLDGLRDTAGAEVRRRVLVLAAAGVLYVMVCLAVVFGGVAVVLAFRDTHPALAAAGVAATFLLLAVAAGVIMVRAHRRRPAAGGLVMSLLALLIRARRSMR